MKRVTVPSGGARHGRAQRFEVAFKADAIFAVIYYGDEAGEVIPQQKVRFDAVGDIPKAVRQWFAAVAEQGMQKYMDDLQADAERDGTEVDAVVEDDDADPLALDTKKGRR